MDFSGIDIGIFIGYICCIMGFGIWIANREKNVNSQDYFLASKSLPWWAVGGSLIASNISTEQILGMNGSGYVMGLAIGAYELMAALTLLIVAKFFLPVFIKNGIYSMPQFLEKRFGSTVRTIMAFFWVALFLFVNITSVFYLGGLAIQTIIGYENIEILNSSALQPFLNGEITTTMVNADEFKTLLLPDTDLSKLYDDNIIKNDYHLPLMVGIIFLALYSAAFSVFGGLKAVVWTDVVQVVVLVIGGLMAAYFVLNAVSDGGGFFAGLSTLYDKVPEKFDMILSPDNPSYKDLPGIGVLVGGLWIANIYYWGSNQYIIQRALAAKSIKEAQTGVAFAAFMKLLMPLFVVVPGIAAFVLGADILKPDQAFPWVLTEYVSDGFKGLVFAALVAAIGSSVSSMANSISTIFTLDIYQPLLTKGKDVSDSHLVRLGKWVAGISLVIGVLIAPLLGSLDQVFQYIQEYTGLISPGVVAVFFFGIFWKRTTSNAALAAILLAVPLNIGLRFILGADFPFLDRMGFCFLALSAIIVGISLMETNAKAKSVIGDMRFRWALIATFIVISLPTGLKFILEGTRAPTIFEIITLVLFFVTTAVLMTERNSDDKRDIEVNNELFKTGNIFNITAFAVTLILAAIYILLW
ncbi:MAG: sodium/solute symporter [Bacteroidota bacterium]